MYHPDSLPFVPSSPLTFSSPEKDSSSSFDTSTDSLRGCEKGMRRASKSFAERKRRAKINECLHDLQRALCSSEKLTTHEKRVMEKVEVLRLSIAEISRLRNEVAELKRELASPMAEGYRTCMRDTTNVIRNTAYLSSDMKHLLTNDLSKLLSIKGPSQRIPLSQRKDFSRNSVTGASPWHCKTEFPGICKEDYVDPLLWRPW